jgi:hypothetical protein
MWSFWRDRSLQFCEQWMAAYEADQLATVGGAAVVSISGGGESETRGDYGAGFTMENIRCCRRRMSMLNPTKYPPLSTRQKPDFSSLTY